PGLRPGRRHGEAVGGVSHRRDRRAPAPSRALLSGRCHEDARSLRGGRRALDVRDPRGRQAHPVRPRAVAADGVVPDPPLETVSKPGSDLDRELRPLEAELKRLEAEYNMFFAGWSPKLPWEQRK